MKRSELYELVWTKSVVKIARELAMEQRQVKEARSAQLPAKELEDAVFQGLDCLLVDEQRMMVLLESCDVTDAAQIQICLKQARALGMELLEARTSHKIALLQRLVHCVLVQSDRLRIELRIGQLLNRTVPASDEAGPAVEAIEVPIELRRVGMAVCMIVHAPGKQGGRMDDRLLAMVAKAHDWFERLSSGRNCNVTEIATAEKVSNAYVIRVLHLAFLAPDIVQRFREGNYPTNLN
jgi:hypothetical protein